MIQSDNIYDLLKDFDLQDFLLKNQNITPSKFLLSYKGNKNILYNILAEQLKVYRKACHKLPTFALNHCWYTIKSYEQCSSETTAQFKASLFSGNKCLDLSGGLGVDDWAFSTSFLQVVSIDPDSVLNTLVKLNWLKLNLTNCQRIETTAAQFLETCTTQFDLVYLDADRRTASNQSFLLSNSAPDYFSMESVLKNLTSRILLKLSPYIDLHYLMHQLQALTRIYVVSVQNEVKEVLALIEPSNLTDVNITAVDISAQGTIHTFTGIRDQAPLYSSVTCASHFFEPAAAIIKAGLSIAYANSLNLVQLDKNTAFYLGNAEVNNFMGRSFKIVSQNVFSKSFLNQYLKTNEIEKANITKRNFNISVEEIRKAFKIKEGGKDYLFFATLKSGEKMVYHCQKIA